MIRQLIARWHRQKSNIVIRIQSVARMWLSNTCLKSQREKEEYVSSIRESSVVLERAVAICIGNDVAEDRC